MSPLFITVIDRNGIRWTKFNTLYGFVTDVPDNKHAARDLVRYIDADNVRDYGQLELDDSQRVIREQRASKYVNDAGVIQYCKHVNVNKVSMIRDALSLHNTQSKMCVVSTETVTFVEDSFNINETFVTIRIDTDEIWVEGLKLSKAFGYKDPYNVMNEYVDFANKRKYSDFCKSPDFGISVQTTVNLSSGMADLSPDTVFINKAAVIGISQRSNKPILKRFWHRMNRELAEKYDFQYSVSDDEIFAVPRLVTDRRGEDEPMDTTPTAHELALLRKDTEIEKMRMRLEFAERENDLRLELIKRDSEAQLAMAKRDVEEQRLRAEQRERETHMLYLFHSDKARALGRAALTESVRREIERRKHENLHRLVDRDYKLIRNMHDTAPHKVNYLGLIGNGFGRYKVFRQQRATMDRNYDFVIRVRDGEREPLNPNRTKRNYVAEWTVYGEPIEVAHGVNLWNSFKSRDAASFGLDFDDLSPNEFSLLDESELRERYRTFAEKSSSVDERYSTRMFRLYSELFDRFDFADEEDCVGRSLSADVWSLHARLEAYATASRLDSIKDEEDGGVEDDDASVAATVDALLADVALVDRGGGSVVTAECFPVEFEVMTVEAAYNRRRDQASAYIVEAPPSSSGGGGTLSEPSHLDRYLNDLQGKRQTTVMKYSK